MWYVPGVPLLFGIAQPVLRVCAAKPSPLIDIPESDGESTGDYFDFAPF